MKYALSRLSDGRVMFAPDKGPSHTFPNETAARWFVKGWHYSRNPNALPGSFTIECE